MQEQPLILDLRRWQAYTPLVADSAQGSSVTLIETHISWVFLLAEHVFKLKKPVDFGFLDFTTLERRRAACEAELALNRRLAEGVYLAVVPITRGLDGRHQVGGSGELVDYAVHMRRLPEERRADELLRNGAFERSEVDRVAQRLYEFHASAPDEPRFRHFGSVETVLANVEENFAQTRASITRYLSREQALELEKFQRDFLAEHAELFARRAEAGRVREGHGDLRLEHVYLLEQKVAVIDCIEFNERFRFADVCADIAFLSMDLAEHGRVDLAERLLSRYALLANDFGSYRLVDFYQSYRAHVRAKVAGFQADSEDQSSLSRERCEREARRHYLLALSAARRTFERPVVVVVCGLIASGKSSVGDALSATLAAPVVVADRIRKALAGVSAEASLASPAFAGQYSHDATAAVYAQLLTDASTVLASGRSVILDASFRARAQRLAARDLARRFGASFFAIECRATREVSLQRLEQRAAGPSVSDGNVAIFDDFARRFEPVDELDPSEHIVLDTGRPLEESVAQLRSLLVAH